MVVELGREHSVLNTFICELRDQHVQKDPMRFRRNMERVGEIMAYELSKTLEYEEREVTSSLGVARMHLMKELPVLATILRAGLPLHQGMLNVFDRADNVFISAYRKHLPGQDAFEIEVEYLSGPPLDERVLVISDPMLATGRSMVTAYRAVQRLGKPKALHVVSTIASSEGIEHLKTHLPANTRIWVAAIDEELTAQAYIVPGLGDAGDLAYGNKI